MTIEQKAQRYDEALKRAKKLYEQGTITESLSYVFSELKESEDEMIRKELIKFVKSRGGFKQEYIAWLEKQGEQKPADDLTPQEAMDIAVAKCFEQGEQKPTDKIEPKFKVGNKIKLAKEPKYPAREIIAIQNDAYYFDEVVHLPFSHQDEWELVEQKPAWSEKDEAVLDALIRRLEGEDIHVSPHLAAECIRTLKDILQLQPKQEWSEEDEVKINRIVTCLENLNVADNDILLKDIEWLKSLRPQNRWKPSEEQLRELRCVISECSYDIEPLVEIEEYLKKLREE